MELLLQMLNKVHPMSEPLTDYLKQHIRLKQLSRKDFLLKAGHICQCICFIETGLLRCFYIKDNAEINSWFMREGDVIISVESFFLQKPGYENIQALEDCELYYINYRELQHLYRDFPEFNFIGRVITEKYYALSEQRLFAMRMQRSHERYAYLMDHSPELIQRVPSKHLASYIGITDVTLSNIKSKI